MALSLSHRRGTLSQWTPYSFKVCLIHSNWVQALAAATYSASAVERDIQFCFLEDQHTKDLPRNWHAPVVIFFHLCPPPNLNPCIHKEQMLNLEDTKDHKMGNELNIERFS